MIPSKYAHRDEGIAIAKALGIFLMVVGHCSAATGNTLGVVNWQFCIHRAIYTFHMPLFFILPGYLFKMERIEDPWSYIQKKIKGLYFPYVKWMLAFLLLHNLFWYMGVYGSYLGGAIPSRLGRYGMISGFMNAFCFGCARNIYGDQFLGGFWFIPVLFQVSIIVLFFFIANKRLLGEKCNVRIGGGIVALIILSMLLFYVHVDEIFINGKTILGVAYFLTGFVIKQVRKTKWINSVVFVFGIVAILFATHFCPVAYGKITEWTQVPLTFLMGVIGSWMLMIGAHWLAKCLPNAIKRLLFFAGENTIVILGLHFLCFKLVDALKVWYYDMSWTTIQEFPFVSQIPNGNGVVWWLAYIVVGFCVPLLLLWGYQKVKNSLIR